jgi:glycosyltransferase involved in cell wall biosynthesis
MKVLVVTNMWPSAERPHWGAFVRSQADSLATLGVTNVLYEIEGWRSTREYWRALRELPRRAREHGVDLVHAHYGLSGAAALGVRHVPLVVSFCGDDLLGRPDARGRLSLKSRALVPLSVMAARRADAVIVKSEEMRRVIGSVSGVEVIPNGVDLSRFAPRPQAEARAALGWPAGARILLFPANPDEPRKNYALAQEVERRLRERGMTVRLEHVYGRPQTEVVTAMNAADVMLLPSFHEGSPNALKEALALNLPVVAAPAGDAAERLRGVTPSAVAERTPAAFTDATARVLAAGARSNGREVVSALAIERVAERVLAVYERALAARRRKAA